MTKKVFTGQVVSTKMEKTAVVRVDRFLAHPLYKKIMRKSKKYLADDQIGVKAGDKVKIEETRPLSKRKRFKIIKIIKKNE